MKITLNSAIPVTHRAAIEGLVARFAAGAKLDWQPSRFPRLVMLVEPADEKTDNEMTSSIFDEVSYGGLGNFSTFLEDKIQKLLCGASVKAAV